ncbi:PQQ-dependent sugar dehydrogenase [Spirillospora sp. NPDC047279]|uniref:PQQ-dependent sugar dehydrogenase n=1 Tax=Spirillospora sp. NPDC047279 TaxID=3155478 RepID=UPI0033ECD81A
MRKATMILVLPLVAACSGSPGGEGTGTTPPPATATPTATSTGLGQPRDVTTGLAVPWGIAFLPGGDALVTERNSARVLRVTKDGRATSIGTVPGVSAEGEGGLMGVAVSPAFATDRLVYLHFTADDDNRVVRFRYDDKVGRLEPLITGIPKGSNHNGGRIAFGPDGYLYVATGEVYETHLAQDKDSLGGKILRVTPEGRPAPGNPFGNRVWTYGHRNVQGLAWDEQGRMYATEFGQDTYDEINRIEKGKNYGWPEVEGVGGKPQYTDPLLTWSTDESSPSGLAYAKGSLWAAGLRGARLWQVPLTADGKAARPTAHFTDRYGRLRTTALAPDGTLWFSTSNKDGRGDPNPGDDRILTVPLP